MEKHRKNSEKGLKKTTKQVFGPYNSDF